MIPADAFLEVAWLDLADVVPVQAEPFDLGQVAFYVTLLGQHNGAEAHVAPPLVNAPDHRGRYTIRDGRHRYAAHLMLARQRIRCLVVKEP